jgi:hypothetical protein
LTVNHGLSQVNLAAQFLTHHPKTPATTELSNTERAGRRPIRRLNRRPQPTSRRLQIGR